MEHFKTFFSSLQLDENIKNCIMVRQNQIEAKRVRWLRLTLTGSDFFWLIDFYILGQDSVWWRQTGNYSSIFSVISFYGWRDFKSYAQLFKYKATETKLLRHLQSIDVLHSSAEKLIDASKSQHLRDLRRRCLKRNPVDLRGSKYSDKNSFSGNLENYERRDKPKDSSYFRRRTQGNPGIKKPEYPKLGIHPSNKPDRQKNPPVGGRVMEFVEKYRNNFRSMGFKHSPGRTSSSVCFQAGMMQHTRNRIIRK